MKFIARKGAPNIPLELIEAQESEKLVFFCGAGVSYSAGLPVFYGLVENVFKNLGIKKNDTEVEAIKSGFYDRALGLLEARIVGRSISQYNSNIKSISIQIPNLHIPRRHTNKSTDRMNKLELTQALKKATDLSKPRAAAVVDHFFNEMADAKGV